MIYAFEISKDNFAPAKITSISTLLNLILPLLTAGAALITLSMALYGAFMYLTNGDKPDVLKKAQAIIIYAFIGLLIVVSSFVVIQLIGKIFNIPKII
ncbi:MAG: hypothetical protein KatS3mg092_0208 [Patescibacteria group bacterium]|nr:MAG: hypothetical protein KatS3mg092_0208 [Patescibacteria group bacterium]